MVSRKSLSPAHSAQTTAPRPLSEQAAALAVKAAIAAVETLRAQRKSGSEDARLHDDIIDDHLKPALELLVDERPAVRIEAEIDH